MGNIVSEQSNNIKELIKLKYENPKLEIVPMVDTDCCPCDDYRNWMASWGKAKIDHYYIDDERVYFKDDSEDKLIDKLIDDSDYTVEKAKEIVNSYEWKKCIVVNINPF
jgi:hypothetical protein